MKLLHWEKNSEVDSRSQLKLDPEGECYQYVKRNWTKGKLPCVGNVQLWLTSCQFCPLDGVLIITPKKANITKQKSWKNSWNFVYILATQCRTPFILMIFFTKKKSWKNSRESLFTFKLHTTELLSFWRDFAQKKQNSIWRHLAVILGTIGTKVDLPL